MTTDTTDAIQSVNAAIRSRHSIRRFLPTPVSKETLRELLELGSCAPSGTNVQPWRVYALAGKEKETLSAAIMERFTRGETDGGRELDYYPKEWAEPWLSRRRKCGLGLYSLLGIVKGDTERMKDQTGRNFQFFDAPVGLIFTLDNRLGKGMLVNCGMFMGNLMAAARARGIDTCVQAFFADYHQTIRTTLGIPDNEIVYCGMALGYGDPDAPENKLITEREPVEGFTDFRGF